MNDRRRGEVPVLIERRRGRPPLTPGERSVSISIAIPAALFDALARQAAEERMDLAPYVRRRLTEFST